MTFKIHTNRSKPVASKKTLNIPALQDPIQTEEYKKKVEENLTSQKKPENIQDKWSNIIKATLSTAEETVGNKTKKHQYRNEEIQKLSVEQKKLKVDMESINCDEKKKSY